MERSERAGTSTAFSRNDDSSFAPSARTPTKHRSLSDSIPKLSPSPKLKESSRRQTLDDQAIIVTPSKLSRRNSLTRSRGLWLQMPPTSTTQPDTARRQSTPEFEQREAYGSPSTVLPRHSRGLDFARACTNLHHSTLADRSSPGSSPTITQKSMMIPSRRLSTAAMAIDPPRMSIGGGWASNGFGFGEKGFVPRSYGSTTALTSDASSSSSDDDDVSMRQDDGEDAMLSTPQMRRHDGATAVTPFGGPRSAPRGFRGGSPMNFHFNHQRRSRAPSSGAKSSGGGFDNARPSVETSNDGFLSRDVDMLGPPSRRESISLGTRGLHISSSNDSPEDAVSMPAPATPGVVRRPVTRRSNLLPKTKNFARVRAALNEEHAPIDSEALREAEIIRQVKVSDVGMNRGASMPPSPNLTPTVPSVPTDTSDMSDADALGINETAGRRVSDERRSSVSTNKEFWSHLYNNNNNQTTSPTLFHRGRSSSNMSEDPAIGVDSPRFSTPPSSILSTANTTMQDVKPDPVADQHTMFQAPNMPTQAEISRKVNKRRRDEDFDIASIKRRAVSPGMSVHSSPVTGQSPVSNSGGWGSQAQKNQQKESTGGAEERPSSTSSVPGSLTPSLGPKRVGFQGMTDTNEAIMNLNLQA